MRVLGIDPSTCTGLAVVESGKKVIHAEEASFPKLRGLPRIAALAERVLAVHEQFKPDMVVIEELIVGQAASAITVIQIGTVFRYFLWQSDIEFLEAHPSKLKKFVSGSGNSKKEAMMMHVQRRWDFTSKTNNIADAVGLGMLGLCCGGEKFEVASTTVAMEVRNAARAKLLKA